MNKNWHRVCASGDLRANEVRRIHIGEEPYALFRGARGTPVAIEDRCLHRGAPLSAGKCKDGSVQCPYHGWSYDQSGQVMEVPSEGGCEAKSRGWRAKTAAVKEEDGWILAEQPLDVKADRAMKPLRSLAEADGRLKNSWYIAALEYEVGPKPIRRVVYDQSYSIKNLEGRIHVSRSGAPVAHRVHSGAVWIWPGDLSAMTESPAWSFPEQNNPAYDGYFMITDFENDAGHLVQNFMDVPHTVFVHEGWFRRKSMLKVPMTVDVGQSRVKVTYHQEDDSIGFWQRLLNPKKEPTTHTDEYIFPNLTRVDYRFGTHHFIINSQCTPVSRFQSRVYTWIAFRTGWMTKALGPAMRFYTRQVINQDVEIMKIQGDNLLEIEGRLGHQEFDRSNGYLSTQADELHIAIDRLRQLGKTSPENARHVEFKREREFWI